MIKIRFGRTLLRGTTGVLIGLPFLEEMRLRSAKAADAAAPTRPIPLKKEYEASGPSLEQLAKKLLQPADAPTRLGSQSVGRWFRTGSLSQYTRQWNQEGSPGEKPERRPTRIFQQLFGGVPSGSAPMAPVESGISDAQGQETKNCSPPSGGVSDPGKDVLA